MLPFPPLHRGLLPHGSRALLGVRREALASANRQPGATRDELVALELEGVEGPPTLSEAETTRACIYTGTTSRAIGGTFHSTVVDLPRLTRFTLNPKLFLVSVSRSTQLTVLFCNLRRLKERGSAAIRFFFEFMERMRLAWRAKEFMREGGRTSADIRTDRLVERLLAWVRSPPRHSNAEELAYACGAIDRLRGTDKL